MTCQSTLIFQLYTGRGAQPVQGARATVTDPETGVSRVVVSNSSGRTPPLCVTAPPADISLDPNSQERPYKLYNAEVLADGFLPVTIEGIQVFDGIESIEAIEMNPTPKEQLRTVAEPDIYVLPPNVLLQEPGVREPEGPAEEGPGPIILPEGEDGEPVGPGARILNRVVIPEFITVHLGSPNNTSAQNVTVSFPNYIKNVASSEIYPTWPESALRANIYAQISFALNRIFTEWYRSRGYSFDITNNTAYDQYYVHGRNIFGNISRIVDEIFDEYVRKRGSLNPYFTEYCNGTTVTCDGLSQWGTVPLAQAGYTPLSILRRYYGNDIEIVEAAGIEAVRSSYPGTPLRVGSSGTAVRTIENQLNRIRRNYPAIPIISNVDNSFTTETEAAVRAFQRIFNLAPDGIVGKATWNQISYIYVAVTRLAELGGEQEPLPPPRHPGVIRRGDRGDLVSLAQYFLRVISKYYNEVRPVEIDGIFGANTEAAVRDFQNRFGLTVDGIVGPATWNSLYNVFLGIANTSGLAVNYPGYLLREGSRGDTVWLMQEYLRRISQRYPIPTITADGIFGPATRAAVTAFQRLFGLVPDGIIGKNTWDRIVAVRLLI